MPIAPTVAFGQTQEFIASASVVKTIPRMTDGRAIEIQNLGGSNLWVAINATPVIGKCRRVQPGETWAFELPYLCPLKAISEVDQVTTQATIVNEVRVIPTT